MAGDWIKVEHATVDKPEVLQMAELLDITADDVLGKLIRVWIWFDVQSRDGNAGSVTGNALKRFIDRLVASQGFANCMQKVGWLTEEGIPNFDRHNGETSKKRALTNKRVKRLRNADIVTDALPEKRREEKKQSNATVPVTLPSWVPEDAWASFAEMRAKLRAPLTDRAKALAVAELSKLRDQGQDPRAVLEQSTMKSWRGLFPVKGNEGGEKPAGLPSFT